MLRPKVPNIRLRKLPSGDKTYFLDYVDPVTEKRIRKIASPRLAEAKKEAHRIYDELQATYFGETTRTLVAGTVDQVIDAYLISKTNRIRASSINRYNIYLVNFREFMRASFPTINMIADVKKAYIEEFLQTLHRNGQVPGTINAELRIVKSLFDFAVKEGYLRENPIGAVERFKDEKGSKELRFWTEADLELIFNTVPSHWRPIYEFIYHTGVREGELINLKWDAVELEEGQEHIKIQASEDWVPKTNERREIPLNERALKIIKQQPKLAAHNYVFTAKEGGKIKSKTIYDNLVSPVKRLCKEKRLKYRGSVHTLRHSFASHLVMNDAGLETVSKLLGHSSLEITMSYAHLAPDHLRKAVGLLVKHKPATE